MESLPLKRSRVPRRARVAIVLGAAVVATSAALWQAAPGPSTPAESPSSWAPAPVTVGGLEAVATIDGRTFTVHTAGGERTFLPGVNLGATVPARYPGELALTAEDYARWFPQMVEMGFRAIRIYTIHPPAFYEELLRYNTEHPETPLYLLHGVWPPEELMASTRDVWNPGVVEEFRREIEEAVSAVHGELGSYHLHPELGPYTSDVSPWLVAWIIGAEWDPGVIRLSDETNAGALPYRGEWVSATDGATPMESWLAAMFDHLAEVQSHHNRSVPLSFVNWPTTDPLSHPAEPDPDFEDRVSIDANHIDVSAWPGGQFAGYHAYPYFPDFMRYEYAEADEPYGAYLDELMAHHAGMPVMVTEYGVSGGWAYAHHEPRGRHHGMHREQEQMQIDADLLRVIHDRGLAGGIVFEWTDEWFKFSWNTLAYMQPGERRALWHDVYTNESSFGMVAVPSGAAEAPVVIDGDRSDWDDAPDTPGLGLEAEGELDLDVLADASFLYLAVRLPERWNSDSIVIEFDARRDDDAFPMSRLILDPGESELQWWWEFDPFVAHHGANPTEYTPVETDVGGWNPIRLLTGRVHNTPWGDVYPAEVLDASEHVRGTSDPDDPEYDSRAGWEAEGRTIEIRVPWLAVGFSDPSSLRVVTVADDGTVSGRKVDGVGISVASSQGGVSGVYRWDPWDAVAFHERIKVGAEEFAAVNLELAGR